MLRLLDSYWKPIDDEIASFFYEHAFSEIFQKLGVKKSEFHNDKAMGLVDALRSGRVFYKDGVFTGSFNVKMSKELHTFATFDSRSNTWRGTPPVSIQTIAKEVNAYAKKLNDDIKAGLSKLQKKLESEAEKIQFSIGETLLRMNEVASRDLHDLGIYPDMTQKMKENLLEDYRKNQRLNIKNWIPEQIERLRIVIERNAENRYPREQLLGFMQAQWNITRNKATFLAKQETSLFLSKFRRERFLDAGVTQYIWRSSHDSRCRKANKYGGPSHGPGGPLDGKTFTFGEPPISGTRGEREEPGEPFGCRCVARPIV